MADHHLLVSIGRKCERFVVKKCMESVLRVIEYEVIKGSRLGACALVTREINNQNAFLREM